MKKTLIIIACSLTVLLISIFLYAKFIGTKGLKVKEYLVINKLLPKSFYGTKIVQISDIHYGRTIKEKELNKIIKKVNELKPDIVIITGDTLDKDINYTQDDLDKISNNLNKINSTHGKYIISGNHDLLKENDFNELLSKLNFINLDDNYQVLYNGNNDAIMLSGLSTMDNKKNINEKLLNSLTQLKDKNTNIKYNILITHEPDVIDKFDYKNYNLILAGHSHGGQVRLPLFGAIVLPKNAKKYYDNYYKLKSTDLYISSGLGTSTVNLRLNNKPSINLYRLVNK